MIQSDVHLKFMSLPGQGQMGGGLFAVWTLTHRLNSLLMVVLAKETELKGQFTKKRNFVI